MAATTNQMPQPTQHFSLDQLSAVMMDRKKVPVGFFVSQALWDGMSSRVRQEAGFGLGTAPITLQGVKIAIDPDLPEKEFDVAFTEEAWAKRLASLSNGE